MSVFISYSSREMETATKICEYLEENGFECWIAPRNVIGGENYPTQIVNAIRNCDYFLLLASGNTNMSGHVSNEVDIAFNCKKVIIPFKLENIKFTDEYTYFLGRKHQIDAYKDMNSALHLLIAALKNKQDKTDSVLRTDLVKNEFESQKAVENEFKQYSENKDNAVLNRKEIVEHIIEKSKKYPYNLYDKNDTAEKFSAFSNLADCLFNVTVNSYYNGKIMNESLDVVSVIADELSEGSNKSVQVQGLPGSAKNMILQLVFIKMLKNYELGKSDCLPFYISSSYYEKALYNTSDIYNQMKSYISRDLEEYFNYLNHNAQTRPIIIIDAIREHRVSTVSPENILSEILSPLGNFNRLVAIDTGLIKNNSRLKKVIPITGSKKGYSFVTKSVPIGNKDDVIKVINTITAMYDYDIKAQEIYNTLKNFKYSTIDIFLIRLIAKELLLSYDLKDIKLTDMYEKLALNELFGAEEKLNSASISIFNYIFNDFVDLNNEYKGTQWSLPHKHNTYLEFLIAYYFINRIKNYKSENDYSFFKTMLTSNANHFVADFLKDNYLLQKTLFDFVKDNYDDFDIRQKSNAMYWLGHVRYSSLVDDAVLFLMGEFNRLKPIIKTNNKSEKENLDNHFLFRSVCAGLLLHSQTNILDEFLCIIIANDIANLINRGATIEYYGDSYQIAAYDEYYLDTDFSIGEQAIQILNGKIETSLFKNSGSFVEYDLITMLTLLQARMQNQTIRLRFIVLPYVKQAIYYIDTYQKKPQYVSSGKIKYYLKSIREDFQEYLNVKDFDIGPMVYNKYRALKEIKLQQWMEHNIFDPESVSEHIYSAWLLAALFLPEESSIEEYSKREILDMLLVHDMAAAELGTKVSEFSKSESDMDKRNNVLKKLFLKGTYPDISNLTYYYNIWTGYYNGININARTARDINLIQTVYTFCEYYNKTPDKFEKSDVTFWMDKKNNLMTELGYQIFARLIENNTDFEDILNVK